MIIPRGSVQQMVVLESGLAKTRFRACVDGVFDWTDKREDRFIFADHDDAVKHSEELRAQGERSFPVVEKAAPDPLAQYEAAVELRKRSDGSQGRLGTRRTRPSRVSPEESFALNEKKGLA